MREQHAEIVRSGGVTVLILVREPLFGLGELVLVEEALAEVECNFGGRGRRCRYGISQGHVHRARTSHTFGPEARKRPVDPLLLIRTPAKPPSDLIERTLLSKPKVPERGTIASKRGSQKALP